VGEQPFRWLNELCDEPLGASKKAAGQADRRPFLLVVSEA